MQRIKLLLQLQEVLLVDQRLQPSRASAFPADARASRQARACSASLVRVVFLHAFLVSEFFHFGHGSSERLEGLSLQCTFNETD
jgi:hypothetical protein